MTEKGIKVLSLFDGISCGMVALQKANIPVDTYYSSEISIDAITISENNWCGIIKRLGDVRNWKSWNIDWAEIDLLIGGFPCTNISLAGKREGLNGNESSLFYYYCDIKAHIMKLNPNLKFFVENTISSSCHLHEISNYLGVYPVKIDSCIVSAQNRKRLYWANFGISQPPTKHILLQDIVTSGFVTCEK